jgi:hypothetical protein
MAKTQVDVAKLQKMSNNCLKILSWNWFEVLFPETTFFRDNKNIIKRIK